MESKNFSEKKNNNFIIISGHQPVYLPWLGLFHKLYLCDKFVFMDTVQYLDGDWNNRNKIRIPDGSFTLTVPIDRKKSKSKMLDKIVVHGYENPESKDFWQKKHWESIKINYKKSKYFDEFAVELEEMYLKKNWKYLIDICWHQFNFFRKCLGLDNKEIVRMSDFSFEGTKDDLILDHCKKLNGDAVVFGFHGKEYVDINKFSCSNILVYFQNYIHPIYQQRFKGFESNMSVLDLLFNYGSERSREILLGKNISYKELRNSTLWSNYESLTNSKNK